MVPSAEVEAPQARNRTPISPEDAQHWCRKLGCSARELDQALQVVGRNLPRLRAHISRERAGRAIGRRLSPGLPRHPPTSRAAWSVRDAKVLPAARP